MAKILLTNRALYALVDDSDFDRVSRYRWQAASSNSTPYVKATVKDNEGKIIFLHRVVMNARGKKEIVDHINGNPLDNRRENLRFVTHAMNVANRHSHKEVLVAVRKLEASEKAHKIVGWKRRPDRDRPSEDGIHLAYQEASGHVFHFPPGMMP